VIDHERTAALAALDREALLALMVAAYCLPPRPQASTELEGDPIACDLLQDVRVRVAEASLRRAGMLSEATILHWPGPIGAK
jgi:hypothetical protein